MHSQTRSLIVRGINAEEYSGCALATNFLLKVKLKYGFLGEWLYAFEQQGHTETLLKSNSTDQPEAAFNS